MTNKEMAMKLIDMVVENEIMRRAIKELLAEEKPSVKAEKKETTKKTAPKRKPIDWPKAEACRKAGWDYAKIADELGTSYQTVYGHFKTIEGVS